MEDLKGFELFLFKVDDILKHIILFLKKVLLINFFSTVKFKKRMSKEVLQATREKIFMIGTPCHGNLGDHAIVYAQKKFIKDLPEDKTIIEISYKEFLEQKEVLSSFISKKDLIVIDGGGNLGTLWINEDDVVTDIIKTFKNNKIVIFPQTCFYDNTKKGKERFENNKKVYEDARNLTLFLRDKASYDFCVKNYTGINIGYTPDIVLYIDDLTFTNQRDGCLLVFRKDVESTIDKAFKKEVKKYLKENNIKYSSTDTVDNQKVNMFQRDKRLLKKWEKFACSKLVITDRLHGMIFALITNTPCIALDNSSKKVSGVYQWIKSADYIKVCSSKEELTKEILKYYGKENCNYSKRDIEHNYIDIKKSI